MFIKANAEVYDLVEKTYSNASFSKFDFATVKRALIDDVRLNFSEVFNDFSESSELIMIINAFAYISELYAYRLDINTQENFIQLAQLKRNVIRLAKWIGYNPSRNVCSKGLVKITSIMTNADVYDARNTNLKNRSIAWNDLNNPFWKEQFNRVAEHLMVEKLGNVTPSNRVQFGNTIYERYNANNQTLVNGVLPFSVSVDGKKTQLEAISTTLYEDGIQENTPTSSNKISIFYLDDGLGDASPGTGFFMFVKQGNLQQTNITYDGKTQNIETQIGVPNINNEDVWVLKLNDVTEEPEKEWIQTEKLYFNPNLSQERDLFKVVTQDNDNITIEYGDGVFSSIPNGKFKIWYRTSNNPNYNIPQKSIVNVPLTIPYINLSTQYLCSITVTAINTIANGSSSEEIDHIRQTAILNYQTQDRMVTGYDYNVLLRSAPSILKLKTVNRTYLGDSAYIKWNDANKQDLTLIGDDLILYYNFKSNVETATMITAEEVIDLYLSPKLNNFNIQQKQAYNNAQNPSRTWFTVGSFSEYDKLLKFLGTASATYPSIPAPTFPIAIFKRIDSDEWDVVHRPKVNGIVVPDAQDVFVVDRKYTYGVTTWYIYTNTCEIIAESATSKFTTSQQIVNMSSNLSNETLSILRMNTDADGTILGSDYDMRVVNSFIDNLGNKHNGAISVVCPDTNSDGKPDNFSINEYNSTVNLINQKVSLTPVLNGSDWFVVLPSSMQKIIEATNDVISIKDSLATSISFVYVNDHPWEPTRRLKLTSAHVGDVTITLKMYVYFTTNAQRSRLKYTDGLIDQYALYEGNNPNIQRFEGRDGLYYKWVYEVPYFTLVDPQQSNIHDCYVITSSMVDNMNNWLNGITQEYKEPTTFDLTNSFSTILAKKVASDTVIFVPGSFKLIFGSKSDVGNRMFIDVMRHNTQIRDAELQQLIVDTVHQFFAIEQWNFGQTFFTSELISVLMTKCSPHVKNIVIRSASPMKYNEPVIQINANSNEIIYPNITLQDIVIS